MSEKKGKQAFKKHHREASIGHSIVCKSHIQKCHKKNYPSGMLSRLISIRTNSDVKSKQRIVKKVSDDSNLYDNHNRNFPAKKNKQTGPP